MSASFARWAIILATGIGIGLLALYQEAKKYQIESVHLVDRPIPHGTDSRMKCPRIVISLFKDIYVSNGDNNPHDEAPVLYVGRCCHVLEFIQLKSIAIVFFLISSRENLSMLGDEFIFIFNGEFLIAHSVLDIRLLVIGVEYSKIFNRYRVFESSRALPVVFYRESHFRHNCGLVRIFRWYLEFNLAATLRATKCDLYISYRRITSYLRFADCPGDSYGLESGLCRLTGGYCRIGCGGESGNQRPEFQIGPEQRPLGDLVGFQGEGIGVGRKLVGIAHAFNSAPLRTQIRVVSVYGAAAVGSIAAGLFWILVWPKRWRWGGGTLVLLGLVMYLAASAFLTWPGFR